MDEAKRIAAVFVGLADTLVENFDVVDFLHNLSDRCVELLGVDAAGVLLTDHRGGLQVAAATPKRPRMLDLLELQVQEGPCLECLSTGQPVANVDVAESHDRWPTFTPAAAEAGFGTTHALPMQLRGRVIGALNLFTDDQRRLSDTDLAVGQAMADVATIGLLHQRNSHEQTVLTEQLQAALSSRVLVEQAKGVLAAHTHLDVDEAFHRMRAYARRNNLTLAEVAAAVVHDAAPSMSNDRLSVGGEVDIAAVPELRQRLDRASAGGTELTVDLSAVTFIDCAGLAPLLEARMKLSARGGTLRLLEPSDSVLRLLQVSETLAAFTIVDALAQEQTDANPAAQRTQPHPRVSTAAYQPRIGHEDHD